MNDLKEAIKSFNAKVENFAKNPNRKYTAKFILDSITVLEQTHNKCKIIINKLDESVEINKILINQYSKSYKTLKEVLGEKQNAILDENNLTENQDGQYEMASFDLYQTIKIVPEFKGKFHELENFLNIIELVNENLKDETEKNKLIKSIWTLKIDANSKIRINNNTVPKTYEELKQILVKCYPNKDTIQTLHSELSRVNQNGLTLEAYTNKIENIIQKLNKLNKSTMVDGDTKTIENLNEQLALSTFKEGLNEPIKSFVVAARGTTFSDAVKLAKDMEAASKTSSSKNVNVIKNDSRNYNNYNYRNKNRGRHPNNRVENYRTAGNFNSQRHYNPRPSQNKYFDREFRNNGSNYTRQPEHNNNSRREPSNSYYKTPQRFIQNRRINFANSEPIQPKNGFASLRGREDSEILGQQNLAQEFQNLQI